MIVSQQFLTSLIGKPYQVGGTDPTGFDCWGLVNYVYGSSGVLIDKDYGVSARRSVRELVRLTDREKSTGDWLPVDNPSEMCLVAMGVSDRVTHVGIYIGGKVLHCLEKHGVIYQNLTDVRKRFNLKTTFYKWRKST